MHGDRTCASTLTCVATFCAPPSGLAASRPHLQTRQGPALGDASEEELERARQDARWQRLTFPAVNQADARVTWRRHHQVRHSAPHSNSSAQSPTLNHPSEPTLHHPTKHCHPVGLKPSSQTLKKTFLKQLFGFPSSKLTQLREKRMNL